MNREYSLKAEKLGEPSKRYNSNYSIDVYQEAKHLISKGYTVTCYEAKWVEIPFYSLCDTE